jgi:hypothetical protein
MPSRLSQLRHRVFLPFIVFLVCFWLIYVPSSSVSADVFNPGCNLTELYDAFGDVGNNGQADTINLAPGCTYTLNVRLQVNADSGNPLTINGNGATLDGDTTVQVLVITSGANVTINTLTVTRGNNTIYSGGGIDNRGNLTLNNITVRGNYAYYNGGIFSSGGTLTLTNSTVSGNTAVGAGGIYVNNSSVTLNNSTVSGNSGDSYGGIFHNGGSLNLNNSIVANSIAGVDCGSTGTVGLSFSLIEDGSCGIVNGVNGNRTGDPNLGALTGSPAYHPLLNGSIAVNAGSNALIPGGITTDQAGNARIQEGIVDMGSFESAFTPLPTATDTPTNTPTNTPVTPTATHTPTITPPAPDMNIISNGTFSAGLTNWAFSGTTQQISNGALQIAPTSPGGSFFQFVNFNSAGGIFEVNFRAANSSAGAKTLNLMVRSTTWSPLYNCVFALPANAPFQYYRMRFNTDPNSFIPMVLQGALSGDSSMGVLIDDITMVRKTGISVPSTQCTVSPPANTDLIYDGAFNQGTANWAAFNAAMQVVNIGGANGNVLELARWQGTPNGGFYQYNPYSAPANGVLQFTFQIGNQSNTARVINMLVRNPDWTDLHSCFITVPANTPLTSQTILLKTASAWSNIVIQGWIQVGNYTGTPPLPFRFDNLNLQYLPSSGFSGSTQCPGPLPMPQRMTDTPSPTMTPSLTATFTPTATNTPTVTSTDTALPTASETPTDIPTLTPEPPTLTPIPTDTATDVPTLEPPTPEPPSATPEPPTNTPEPSPEVTQNP